MITNLNELPPDASIDELLTKSKKDDILKPFSSRVKLVIEYNRDTKEYVLNESDKEVLKEYIDPQEFAKTVKEIETNPRLRPFDRKTPFCKALGLRLLALLSLLIYIYVCFIVL